MIQRFRSRTTTLRRPVIALSIAAAFGLAATGVAHAQVSVDVDVNASAPGWLYDLGAVVSLFVDPPVAEPEPVAVAWAPPPMLVEELPPQPDPYAVWTGGYWTWQGDWVWCAGRWMDPPREEYVWVQPYYEHRDERVIFIPGYWSAADAEFIAPPMDGPIPWAYVNAGVVIGPAPEGPAGIFVPPPPGSRPGLIIPAPIGTPPAVVISAPAVLAVGMRITGSVVIDARHTTINDNRVTNYSVTNVRNVTNVTVEAPAGATANGRAFQAQVPHEAHLAAAMHPQVAARAPQPATRTAVAAYVPGHTPAALPAPQKVQGMPAVPSHGAANVSSSQRAQMGHAPMTPAEARQARPGVPAAARTEPENRVPATVAAPATAQTRTPQVEPQQSREATVQQGQAPVRNSSESAQRAGQQRAETQQPQQQQAQQRAQQEQSQHTQQQTEQQRAQQAQAQRAQQDQAQQRAKQEQAQRSQQQAEQQRAQQDQAQQRAKQEQAQRAQQQAEQQQAQQRAKQEQSQHGEQPRPQGERGDQAHPRGEEASRPSSGHE